MTKLYVNLSFGYLYILENILVKETEVQNTEPQFPDLFA